MGILALLSYSSCSPKTPPIALPLDNNRSFTASGAELAPDRWWTAFQDPQLTALVDSTLANNFTLRSAWERVRASRASLDRESSFLLPKIDANLSASQSFPIPDFVGGELVRLGVAADYEVDIWGRINAQIDAQEYRLQASRYDYRALAISLSAEIARTWYQLQEARNQLALVTEQVATNERILGLLENRFGSGLVRGVDILRQRQLVTASRGQLIDIEATAATLEHQLLVLLGRPAQRELSYTDAPLPELPPLPATGVGTELVQRRPDVQGAFQQVQATDRDLAAAISSQYPRLSIGASGSLRSNNLQNLLRDYAYSFSANIFAPIFYAGELKAEVDRTEAVRNQTLYDYGQVLLGAFREVEDALIQERQQRQTVQNLEQQLELLSQTAEQLRLQYFNGLNDYLDVLAALNQEQQLRRDLLTARRQLLEFRIALYRALAGGFETPLESGS